MAYFYRIYSDAILILEVFMKKTNQTPKSIISVCKEGIKRFDVDSIEGEKMMDKKKKILGGKGL